MRGFVGVKTAVGLDVSRSVVDEVVVVEAPLEVWSDLLRFWDFLLA